jgi:hypothetical protein
MSEIEVIREELQGIRSLLRAQTALLHSLVKNHDPDQVLYADLKHSWAWADDVERGERQIYH